jgi:hypothetical protein
MPERPTGRWLHYRLADGTLLGKIPIQEHQSVPDVGMTLTPPGQPTCRIVRREGPYLHGAQSVYVATVEPA